MKKEQLQEIQTKLTKIKKLVETKLLENTQYRIPEMDDLVKGVENILHKNKFNILKKQEHKFFSNKIDTVDYKLSIPHPDLSQQNSEFYISINTVTEPYWGFFIKLDGYVTISEVDTLSNSYHPGGGSVSNSYRSPQRYLSKVKKFKKTLEINTKPDMQKFYKSFQKQLDNIIKLTSQIQ